VKDRRPSLAACSAEISWQSLRVFLLRSQVFPRQEDSQGAWPVLQIPGENRCAEFLQRHLHDLHLFGALTRQRPVRRQSTGQEEVVMLIADAAAAVKHPEVPELFSAVVSFVASWAQLGKGKLLRHGGPNHGQGS